MKLFVQPPHSNKDYKDIFRPLLNLSTIALRAKMLQPKLKVAVSDVNRILLVFSVTLLIYANPALSQLGELMPKVSFK